MMRVHFLWQVKALEESRAAEAKLREEAEQTLDRERRTAQMAGLASGPGDWKLVLEHIKLTTPCDPEEGRPDCCVQHL